MRVTFDPSQISYEQLLEFFWHNIIPIQGDGQFCDRGSAYQSAIFYANAAQKQVAEASPKAIADAMPDGWQGEDIKTRILPLKTFYVAEDYHQDYYKKEPNLYARYKLGCGRADALKSFWGEEAYAMYNAVTKAPSLAPGAGSSLPLQGGFTSASGGLVLGSSNPPVDATEIFGGSLTGESYGGDTSGADNSGGVWLARSGGDVAAGITLLAWLALATVW